MRMDELDRILDSALEDHRLSRNELRALRTFVESDATDNNKRAELRARAFARAKKTASTMGAEATLAWLERVVRVLSPIETDETSVDVHFSPGETCLQAIVGELRRVKKSAEICVFTITDNRITKELITTHKRGVKIRIITDNDKAEDRGSDVDRLAFTGIPLRMDRTDAHMHHKYAVFDGRRVLTGSYNWTRSAASMNQENILITNSLRAAALYGRHFDHLWKQLGGQQ